MSEVTFKSCIPGLDRLIERDIPIGSIVLVTGAPGTLKSAFVYSLMNKYLARTRECGIYFTLEQSKENLIQNMESLGIVKKERGILEIVDFSEFRERFKDADKGINMHRIAEDLIEYFKRTKKEKPTCFALDSLTAMVPFMEEHALRSEIFHLFQLLRKNELTSFIICEVPSLLGISEYSPEYYLGDGVIELGIYKSGKKFGRYIQILKLRGTAHHLNRHRILPVDGGLRVLGPV